MQWGEADSFGFWVTEERSFSYSNGQVQDIRGTQSSPIVQIMLVRRMIPGLL